MSDDLLTLWEPRMSKPAMSDKTTVCSECYAAVPIDYIDYIEQHEAWHHRISDRIKSLELRPDPFRRIG